MTLVRTLDYMAPLRRLILLALGGLGCWGYGGAEPAGAAVVAHVNVVDFAFDPPTITVNVNDQVKWTWVGSAQHSTTSTGGLWDSGLHTPVFAFTNAFPSAGSFPYICSLHGFAGSVTVQGAGGEAPTIVSQPQSQSVAAGQNVSFVVSATGTAPLSYQWQFDGSPMGGATDSSLTLNSVQTTNAGSYAVLVSNAAGHALSSSAVLGVRVRSPFTPMKAAYSGLFYDTNGMAQQSSGSFAIATTATGKFSGSLLLGGARYALSGEFDGLGKATKTLSSRSQGAVTVGLQVDLANANRITGTVSSPAWTATLLGDRAVFDARQNPAPQAGAYTLNFAGADGAPALPGGNGYGIVNVDATGRVRLAGSLADGTKVSQTAMISTNGDWPFYLALYGGHGSMLSWLAFLATPTNDLRGEVTWLKPGPSTGKVYPGGFSFTTTASGARYHPPVAGNNVLNFTQAKVVFSGGDLAEAFTNLVTFGANSRVSNLSSNRLALTFKPSAGSFSGRVINPATSRTVSFSGVVLQGEQVGSGFFLDGTQSGQVFLAP